MYPHKVDASGNPWKLPFLPGKGFFVTFQGSTCRNLVASTSILVAKNLWPLGPHIFQQKRERGGGGVSGFRLELSVYTLLNVLLITLS